ncbi:glycosyltransferase family 2 protein [Rothia halotolerans]|uniref:glycosyltransferase family 2 protein n=1 Tax=Rothia halotolerans TaxID=405770 RepID=UPI00101C4051|nr:glycosyltransferase family 2 protein [Rothia halotolerans]
MSPNTQKPSSTPLRRERVQLRIDQLNARRLQLQSQESYFKSSHFARLIDSDSPADDLRPSRSLSEYTQRVHKYQRRDLVQEIAAEAAMLPDHLGSRLLRPHPYRVGIVADQFLYETFEGTANLVYITPENYRETASGVDVLLVASTWTGVGGEWRSGAAKNLLKNDVMPFFKAQGIPVIFYSKEDPPNYGKFLPYAAVADFIVTSAEEKIPDYMTSCPQAQGYGAVTFGVSPKHHNPVGSRKNRRDEVIFAGSWLGHKYPQRRAHARNIFDGVQDAGRDLLILDRNSELGNPDYCYPEEYISSLGPAVDHSLLMKIQRITDLQINLNSVYGSSTMFANRVVELQAMGASVLSNYSMGVNDQFPSVLLGDSRKEVEAIVSSRGTPHQIYADQMRGLRTAYSHYLARDRMGEILTLAGFPVDRVQPRVALLTQEGVSPEELALQPQTYRNTEFLGADADAAEMEKFDLVLPLSKDLSYDPYVVEDLVNGFKYADVDFIEKSLDLSADAGHQQVERPTRGACVAYDAEAYLGRKEMAGGYQIDPFGARPVVETVELQTDADGVESVRGELPAKSLSVIVPIFNNGLHLRDKCFRSLRRSSVFDQMEIILVDDGSTDGITPFIARDLAREFPDSVRAYFNAPGGSGSASRPRNQGLDLATCEFVTYLDPDNEAVEDGYAKLLRMMQSHKDMDFAIGNMSKWSTSRRKVGNSGPLRKSLRAPAALPKSTTLRRTGPGSIASINFQPMSIQALVARTDWLRSTGIRQPEGALGQDSLMFQEMLEASELIGVTATVIHVYYGAVSNSVVNTLQPKFYRKYFPLERARIDWLERTNLMGAYRERRLRPYFTGWYLHKYNKNVSEEHKPECKELIEGLADLYDLTVLEDQDGVLSLADG